MKSRKPSLLSNSGPPRRAAALPKRPNCMISPSLARSGDYGAVGYVPNTVFRSPSYRLGINPSVPLTQDRMGGAGLLLLVSTQLSYWSQPNAQDLPQKPASPHLKSRGPL